MDKATILKLAGSQKTEDNFDSLISKDITPTERELLFEETPYQRKDNEIKNYNFSHCFFPNDKPRNNYYYYPQKQKYNKPFQRGFYAQKPINSIQHINMFTINKSIINEKNKKYIYSIDNFIDAVKGIGLTVDKPIWYINNKNTKKDEGLFSSYQITNMYNSKEIDEDTLIRPFDVLVKKNTSISKYVQLKDINNTYFIKDNFCINHELLNEISFLFSDKNDINRVKSELKKETPIQSQINIEKIYKKEKENILTNQKEKDIHNNNNNNSNEETIKSKKTQTNKNITTHPISQGKHKKKRAKMVDIDIETGFYTLTQQEANYIPLYIVGDSKKK